MSSLRAQRSNPVYVTKLWIASSPPWRLLAMTVLTALLVCLQPFTSDATLAQGRPDPGELRGLKLGLNAKTMSTDRFGDFACGSNGGPPRQKIDDWSDFAKCRAEES